ncbi:MAG: nucleotidyltransferase domain-containing protein [Candidatus Cloacimonetes bacterium]|nr:nucleotidyltransferase domain-containing protein [Candidatus Cloacimonadota bacterium]
MYIKKDIERINEIILNKLNNIEKLILFGSYAKGTATDESDLDFAIITQKKIKRITKLQILNQLWSDLAKENYEVDLVIKPLEDFDNEKNIIGSLAYTIQKSGRILWKTTQNKN